MEQEALRQWLLEGLASRGDWRLEAEPRPGDPVSALESAPEGILLLDLDGIEDPEDLVGELRQAAPRMSLLLLSSRDEGAFAASLLKRGARDFFPKPLDLDALAAALAAETPSSQPGRERSDGAGGTFLKLPSEDMREIYDRAARVAMSPDSTVLITGESGTGKEIIARLIHDLSPRRAEPFLELNCASIPGELLENELFGHEAGAFTDARGKKPGLFEMAGAGSIFLDEIGEMPLGLQTKLLRFLETRRIRRVGGTRDWEVDVRIVSATNQDLQGAVADGRFREDLFYRLNVVPLRLSPLRDRPDDILPLFEHFAEHFAERFNRPAPKPDAAARDLLLEHPWPGNIRELRNSVERLLLLAEDGPLGPSQVREALGQSAGSASQDLSSRIRRILAAPLGSEGMDLEGLTRELEARMIRKALSETGGNQSRSAGLLGMGRDKLRYRMKTLGIEGEEPS